MAVHDVVQDDELPELDVRAIAIVWSGNEKPRLMLAGCSEYEAIGMMRGAIGPLEREHAIFQNPDDAERCPMCGHDVRDEDDDDVD